MGERDTRNTTSGIGPISYEGLNYYTDETDGFANHGQAGNEVRTAPHTAVEGAVVNPDLHSERITHATPQQDGRVSATVHIGQGTISVDMSGTGVTSEHSRDIVIATMEQITEQQRAAAMMSSTPGSDLGFSRQTDSTRDQLALQSQRKPTQALPAGTTQKPSLRPQPAAASQGQPQTPRSNPAPQQRRAPEPRRKFGERFTTRKVAISLLLAGVALNAFNAKTLTDSYADVTGSQHALSDIKNDFNDPFFVIKAGLNTVTGFLGF